MKESQQELNYARIAESIGFIHENRHEQPGLETIAGAVNLSPYHLQRVFKEWDIAARIDNPRACRAVGTAIGKNPVAYLIPCHRAIRTSGEIGNYHLSEIRKNAIIGRETAKIEI